MLYGTGAASKTERWLNRDQSQHAAQYTGADSLKKVIL